VPDRKTVVQVKFRLRKDVLKQLEKAAKAKDRSVNAEIADRLEESLMRDDLQTFISKAVETSASIKMGGSFVYKREGEDKS
jgi:hypothetical protein